LTPGGIDDGVGSVGCGTDDGDVEEGVVVVAELIVDVTGELVGVDDVEALGASLFTMSHDWMAPLVDVTDPVCPGGVMANVSTPAAV
jgi:hypothetical protein